MLGASGPFTLEYVIAVIHEVKWRTLVRYDASVPILLATCHALHPWQCFASAARDPRVALAGAISRHQAPPETSLRASLLPRAPISEISPPARRRTGLTAPCCACRAACCASALSERGLAKLVVRVAYSPRWAYSWPMISALMLLRAGAHLPPAAGRLREAAYARGRRAAGGFFAFGSQDSNREWQH